MLKLRIVITAIVVIVFLNACGGVTPIPSATAAMPTTTTAKLPIQTAAVTPTSLLDNFYKPSNIYDPKDPSLPELMVLDSNGLKLDPNWIIAKIEYTYDWWGYSIEPSLGYEKIEKRNLDYFWNNKQIDSEKVVQFIKSISNLHPTQSLLVGIWHTDDYPTWQLDLTGIDGNHVLIYASSNENPGYGPWHVMYNGRIYADYGGKIGAAIGKLFDLNEDTFMWKGGEFGDYHPDNLMGFATVGWPNQLWYGFDGLLPLADSFHYIIDTASNELHGYVRGRYSIGGFGNMVVGKVTTLRSVKLSIKGKQLFCGIEKVKSEDTYSEEWTFICKMPSVQVGERYRYPIEVVFDLDTGQKLLTNGVVFGTVGSQNKFWVIPPTEEIQRAISTDPKTQSLLKEATIYVANYNGKIQLGQDASPILSGELVLIGEAEVDGTKVKYSVFTPFIVENEHFTRFGLTELELKRFLVDVVHSPITRRILTYYPDTTLNLWYSSKDNVTEPEMPELWSGRFNSSMKTEVSTCSDVANRVYPTTNEPLRMFTFNSDKLWYPWNRGVGNIVQFMLVDHKTFVDEIYLGWWGSTNQKELDRFWQLLLPSQLQAIGMRPFLQIDYSVKKRQLRITPPYDSTDDQFAIYQKSLTLLPVPFQTVLSPNSAKNTKLYNYKVNGIDIVVRDDGTLAVNSCAK